MLALYMDHHVRAEITAGLRRRGIDVLTAFEDGMAEEDDEHLLERATALKRVLVTQDQDFLRITAKWQRSSREFYGLAFAIQDRVDTGWLIEYLELIAQAKTAEEMLNAVEFIPAR
jgi:Domain of unknown function (DUF5615)